MDRNGFSEDFVTLARVRKSGGWHRGGYGANWANNYSSDPDASNS